MLHTMMRKRCARGRNTVRRRKTVGGLQQCEDEGCGRQLHGCEDWHCQSTHDSVAQGLWDAWQEGDGHNGHSPDLVMDISLQSAHSLHEMDVVVRERGHARFSATSNFRLGSAVQCRRGSDGVWPQTFFFDRGVCGLNADGGGSLNCMLVGKGPCGSMAAHTEPQCECRNNVMRQ